MGGIGGGNFNFLPNGTYNTLYCQVAADAGAMPTCYAFQKRGATVFSATLQNAGSMTTTYTGYWPTVTMQYAQTGINDAMVLKCFSPIITGDGIASDNENSSLPIAISSSRSLTPRPRTIRRRSPFPTGQPHRSASAAAWSG